MSRKIVISLFDYTGEAVRPWAEAGYECHCYDLQHAGVRFEPAERGEGGIWFRPWDSDGPTAKRLILDSFHDRTVSFLFAFPPCTDLAASGAKHWAAKRERNPGFQREAVARAYTAEAIAELLGCPYMIENPNGALSTLWRKADYSFDPCEYGLYCVKEPEHPRWPDVIPPWDAYKKRTRLWTGGGFCMPPKWAVTPVSITVTKANGKKTTGSPQWAKLGGKSERTKNIRSATPRGFARAVFLEHGA